MHVKSIIKFSLVLDKINKYLIKQISNALLDLHFAEDHVEQPDL